MHSRPSQGEDIAVSNSHLPVGSGLEASASLERIGRESGVEEVVAA